MDIFRLTSRPDISQFYKNKDPNDLRLGSLVKSNPLNYEESSFVLVGCPQDEGATRNKGRAGAAKAPDRIRQFLYQMAYPSQLEEFGFFDLGNIILEDTLEKTLEKLHQVLLKILMEDKIAVVLGGGGDIMYAVAKASKEVHPNCTIVNLNSRYNVVKSDQIHNESTYRYLLEEGVLMPSDLVHFGIQPTANSYAYFRYVKDEKSPIIYQRDISQKGLKSMINQIKLIAKDNQIVWGIDLNAVRTADAPGVGHLTPIGLSSETMVEIARYAGNMSNSVLCGIAEVNPEFDLDDRSSRLAATIIIHFVARRVLRR